VFATYWVRFFILHDTYPFNALNYQLKFINFEIFTAVTVTVNSDEKLTGYYYQKYKLNIFRLLHIYSADCNIGI